MEILENICYNNGWLSLSVRQLRFGQPLLSIFYIGGIHS